MGEDEGPEDEHVEPERWAMSLAKSVILSGTVSTMLLVGAGLALLLGVVGAVFLGITQWNTGGLGSSYAVAQICSALSSCLLPAGLLAASAAAIRLQMSRVEAEYVED
jgi:hypothetical protein